MKALSIRQPWAWLIVNGHKDVENRSWKWDPRYTGPLLIHAAKGCTRDEYEDAVEFAQHVDPTIQVPSLDQMERGGIVGQVFMAGSSRGYGSPWFFGPLGLIFGQQEAMPFVPYKGQLGFFDVPDHLLAQHPDSDT